MENKEMAALLHGKRPDMRHPTSQTPRDRGFTLIEMMIVVVIIAVLAAVAVIAYTRHIKSSRLTNERNFCSAIMALQETYYQRFGLYHDTSGTAGGVGTTYPLTSNKFEAKDWKPQADGQPLWVALGARPEQDVTYFVWNVEAGDPTAAHALYGSAAAYGVPAQPGAGSTPHPWYYIEGQGDMDSSSAANTIIYASSGRSTVTTLNEGN